MCTLLTGPRRLIRLDIVVEPWLLFSVVVVMAAWARWSFSARRIVWSKMKTRVAPVLVGHHVRISCFTRPHFGC
jgi:hypothetical protein